MLEDRDQLLAAAWLASLRSARTRRSYAGDLLGWQAWLVERDLKVLGAGRVHVDLWSARSGRAVLGMPACGGGCRGSGIGDRGSGIGSFYRYGLSHGVVSVDPTVAV